MTLHSVPARAVRACCRYCDTADEIAELTREIGDHPCTQPKADSNPFGGLSRRRECLDHYYYGPKLMGYTDMCENCQHRHDLVQRRRACRQALGAVKRELRAVTKLIREKPND